MKHTASKRFWQCLESLPVEIQVLARRNFAQLKVEPAHPSLHFKTVGNGKFYSVRVGLYYRSLGLPVAGGVHGSGSELTGNTTSLSASPSL